MNADLSFSFAFFFCSLNYGFESFGAVTPSGLLCVVTLQDPKHAGGSQ